MPGHSPSAVREAGRLRAWRSRRRDATRLDRCGMRKHADEFGFQDGAFEVPRSRAMYLPRQSIHSIGILIQADTSRSVTTFLREHKPCTRG